MCPQDFPMEQYLARKRRLEKKNNFWLKMWYTMLLIFLLVYLFI